MNIIVFIYNVTHFKYTHDIFYIYICFYFVVKWLFNSAIAFLWQEQTMQCPNRVSFIKICQHDNFATALLPNHPPEVRERQFSGAFLNKLDVF